jgi:hypothetical protein
MDVNVWPQRNKEKGVKVCSDPLLSRKKGKTTINQVTKNKNEQDVCQSNRGNKLSTTVEASIIP